MAVFSGYSPPGVYTKTLLDQSVVQILGTLRIPAIIGVADETKKVSDYDMIRGSSAFRDNKKVGEDVSSFFTSGTNRVFTTSIFPVVSGAGSGKVTDNPNHVSVYVNGMKVLVSKLVGSTGIVTLQSAPAATDVVTTDYYYKLTDTKVIDENVSTQADNVNVDFYSAYAPIVDGSNGGRPTTSISNVLVKVNGSPVAISAVDGVSGFITLVSAPLISDTVTITYYYNQYANTADNLPFLNPTEIEKVGLTPGATDFIEGADFVVKNNQINWGTTYILESGINTPGSTYFDSNQVSVSLVDDKIYKEDVSSQFALAAPANPINNCVVTYKPIVDGTGKDVITENPANVLVYVNSVLVPTIRVDGVEGKVYFTPAITSPSDVVEVTYYKSTMIDEEYSIECKVKGSIGVGKFSITNMAGEAIYLSMDTGTGTATPVFYNGPKVDQKLAVVETITLTFSSSTDFGVTSTNGSGTGSGLTVSGVVGTTFIDDVTGFSFTLSPLGTYVATKTVIIDVIDSVATPAFTDIVAYNDLGGITFSVNNTTGVTVGDTAKIFTYDKSGKEPSIGDTYYITYKYAKTDADYEPKVFTKFKDVVAEYGELSISNPLTLAAYILFINGALAIMAKQVKTVAGGMDAAESAYIAALIDFEKPIEGFNPAIILPLTSSVVVQNAVKLHVNKMSSERYRAERIQIFGTAVGTEAQDVIAIAQGFSNDRSWLVYPDGVVMSLTDAFGTEIEYILDGTYLAIAVAGINVSQAFDVATPMTRKSIAGFKRLVRSLDEVTKDSVAAAGVMVIEEIGGSMRVRHGLTTDLSSPFTSKPEVITIKDEVQRSMRSTLDKYIGKKVLESTQRDIASTISSTMRILIDKEIIVKFANITVEQDPADPSFFKAEVFYVPIVGLDYIEVTFNIRSQL